jgi:hypothetical protein
VKRLLFFAKIGTSVYANREFLWREGNPIHDTKPLFSAKRNFPVGEKHFSRKTFFVRVETERRHFSMERQDETIF